MTHTNSPPRNPARFTDPQSFVWTAIANTILGKVAAKQALESQP